MGNREENKIYDKLPLIYNHIMRHVNYSGWAKYIFRLMKKEYGRFADVLELGGGNCSLAEHMKFFFPKLLVTDISKEMLFSGEFCTVRKVCCDMSLLPFKNKFDIVYSTFDSVNYLTSRKKLLNLFKQVSLILADEGAFTFDVSLENNSYKHCKTPERKGTYSGINFTQKSEYNNASRIHKNTFNIVLDNGEVFREIHKQKIYPFEIYFELLEKAGLYVIDCFEAFSFKPANSNSDRVQFITKKANYVNF